jgi:hypothetical protein
MQHSDSSLLAGRLTPLLSSPLAMTQPSLNKVILKEFQDTCFKSFAQNQIKIEFPDEEDLTKVQVILTPNDGLYEGARIVFSVDLTESYPTRFLIPIYPPMLAPVLTYWVSFLQPSGH